MSFSKLSNRDAFGYPLKFKSASEAGLVKDANPFLDFSPLILLDGDTLTGATDDVVTTWADTSGNDNHAEQLTAGSRPLLKMGADGINGHNAIWGNGSGYYMLSAFDLSVLTEMTWFAVFKAETAAGNEIFQVNNGVGAWGLGQKATGMNNIVHNYPADTDTHVVIADVKADAGRNTWIDGVSVGSSSTGAFSYWASADGLNIMTNYEKNGSWFSGKLAFIAILPTQLSTEDRNTCFEYLNARYLT